MELFTKIWSALGPAQDFVLAVLITLLGTFFIWLFRAKVKLLWGSTSSNHHDFKLAEDQESISIWTEKFYVQNTGRKAASSVEIVFSTFPTSYNLWPPRDHAKKFLENGNFVVTVPSLAPRELLILDTVDIHAKNPRIQAVNCPDVLSKQVDFEAVRQFGTLINVLIAYLILAGLLGTVYFLLQIMFGDS